MKTESRITKRTRNNLINSYWTLYKNGNPEKITIEKICNEANFERTTFYRYFKDISDLLNQLEDSIINNIINELKEKNSNTSGIKYDNFKSFTEKNGEYIVVFLEKGNRNFYNKFKNLIEENVYDYFKFNVNNPNKKEFLFEFIFSSLINSYAYWYRHQNKVSLETFVTFANNLLTIGTNSILKD